MKRQAFLWLASAGHLVNDTAQGAIPALLPLFITQYGLSYQDAAGLVFANTALASVMQPAFGYLADKYALPWLMATGILLTGWSISAMAFFPSYWAIFTLATLAGAGSAIFHPEGARLINKLSGKKKGSAMGTFSVGGSAGFAIGPLMAGLSYIYGKEALLLFGLLNSVVALSILLSLSSMKKELALAAEEIQTSSATSLGEAQNDWKGFRRLSVLILVRAITFTSLATFIPLYWISVLDASTESANLALTVFFSIGVVITLIGGILADRIGFIKVIRYSYLITLPAMALFVNSHSLLLSTCLLLPVGFGLFGQYSPIVVLGQTYLAKSVGFAAGITLGVGITLGGLFTPLIGWAADQYGLQNALQVLIFITAVGLAFSYRLPEK